MAHVKDYLLVSEESQLIIDGLNYGYHYITVYNTDTCDIELIQIECKTNVTDMSDGYNICEFEGIDSVTNGCWKSKYGKGGYDIYTYKNTFDYYVKLVYSGFTNKVWNLPQESDNGQALEVDDGGKIAACKFFGDKAVINAVIAGDETRMLSFYMMDCYDFDRSMKVTVMDAESSKILDSRDVSVRNAGIYVRYKVKGHVLFEFKNLGKAIGVISAVFID